MTTEIGQDETISVAKSNPKDKSTVSLDRSYYKKRHPDSEKLTFLTSKIDSKPAKSYPQTKCRRYLPTWESQFPWLRFS